MGKKIFVSYKFADSSVKNLSSYSNSTVRDYVDELEKIIGRDNIYKGEKNDCDLSEFKNSTIWNKLKEKIFDSSITIVLVSQNMKEMYKNEAEQWIPQEISYSLKEITRNNGLNKSLPNALIYVVLPNSDYFDAYNYFYGYHSEDVIFNIMKDNRNYAVVVRWSDFIKNPQRYINESVNKQANSNIYNITKNINENRFW